MLTGSKAEIARQKAIAELERRGVDWRAVLAQREERPPLPSLQEWCEATLPHPLHEWQKQLCWELEPLKEGGRHRLLIHGPPRYGKSIIVGQRLIPWLIMHNPSWRCPLMTYNIDHSVEFGEVVRDLMRSDVYKQWAPRGAWLEREDCSAQAFKTIARSRTMDGDYSFRALGFQTGFTGKGADCLVGDDPYANPEDAGSEAVNGRTIRTYKNQVRLRVGADSPLIFMYHRYHENDLGGELLAEGDWRNIRFPCIADSSDNEDGSDITGRSDGELLSDLWPEDHIQHIREDDPYTFASMYQGRPKPPGGGFFRSDWFVTGEMPPVSLKVRYWDLATSVKKTGDWTASALAGVDAIQRFCLEDVMRMKGEWPDVCQKIVEITEREAYEFGMRGIRYAVGVDARMSQQGFFQQLMRQRIFDMKTGDGLRVPLWPDKAPIDKKESASGLAADMRYGRFVMKADPVWNQVFKNECLAFTGQDTDTDDQVDAASGCHRLLWALRGATNVEKPKAEVGSPAWFDKLGKKQAGVGLFRA